MVRDLSTKTLPLKNGLFALSFLAGAMFTGSALAQSDEYQRGYDAGYRDGAQAQAQADQDERGDANTSMLVIEEANYGTRERSCDATDAVQAALGRLRQVRLVADNIEQKLRGHEICKDTGSDFS